MVQPDKLIVKKRIFIAIHYMEIGGAERSLLGLLNAIESSRYDVDLFIHQHTGEFMSLIPEKINLLPEIRKYSTLERPIQKIFFEGCIDIVIARLLAKYRARKYIKQQGLDDYSSTFQYISNLTTPLLPSLSKFGEYDLAISFLTPHTIVRDKVRAKKKMAWIHTDYSCVQINAALEYPVWAAYDYIAAISDSVRTSFLKAFPSLAKKVIVIENILSPTFVREQAQMIDVSAEMPLEVGLVRLLSVGRYCPAKNFENVPFICSYLIEQGINVKWYIMGYGGDEDLIVRNIKNTGMLDRVILLGKKNNPYPYMRACDIYVQPSRYEGKAVTAREAQMLFKPVVITDYPTSKSQLKDGFDGVIVPLDNEGAAHGLKHFLEDITLQKKIIENLQKVDYGNEMEIEKIYRLI